MFKPFQYRRLAGLALFGIALFVCLGCRLYNIQIERHGRLAAEARRFTDTTRVLEACRGQVRDRHGKTLAISVPMKTVYANLALCSNRVEQVARTLGPLLQISPEVLAGRLRVALQGPSKGAGGASKALVLKRNVPLAEWQAIASALNLETFGVNQPGLTAAQRSELKLLRHRILFTTDTQVRLYPYGERLSHVLGFVSPRTEGSGLQGICGIERTCDKVLAGEDGKCVSQQDCAGNELPLRRQVFQPPIGGADVVLTIDLRLQQIVEETLVAAMSRYRPRAASAIVMDPRTFEILALAALPNFNPHNPGASPPETWRNPVFSDMVEPGSTFKVVSLAGALDRGLLTLDSGVYCEQGQFIVNKVAVRDHARYGLLSVRQAFAKSSNIGFAKIALQLGPERFYNTMTNFGFGRRTGVPFVGETTGRIEPPRNWSTMTLTRAAFGQGFGVSQLQMAVALCVIANDGRLMRPMLISRIEPAQAANPRWFQPEFVRSVVSSRTAWVVKEALKAAVSPAGTGSRAGMDRYTVAAKTGTAQKSDQHGYENGRYYSSMVGFFPADLPQVVISVALDEPQNGYYAGEVAAPVFHSIAEQVALCLNIPPDKVPRLLTFDLAEATTPGQP